jgi:hypothetical protein
MHPITAEKTRQTQKDTEKKAGKVSRSGNMWKLNSKSDNAQDAAKI